MQEKLEKLWEQRFEKQDQAVVSKVKEFMVTLKKNNYTGVFKIPDEVYHNVPAVSRGQLIDFSKKPLRYYHKNFVSVTSEKSDALSIGSLVHHALLDPIGITTKYIDNMEIINSLKTEYKAPTKSKEYAEAKAEYENKGLTIIKHEDYKMALDLVRQALDCKEVRNIIESSEKEVAVFYKEPTTGLCLKVKLDVFSPVEKIILDVKTDRDATPDEFDKKIYNNGLYVQAAYYLYVTKNALNINLDKFGWIVLEKEEPYDVALRFCDTGSIDAGEEVFMHYLAKLADAIHKNNFEGYPKHFVTAGIPYWAYTQIENRLGL